jgi:hypothetical protein
MEHSIDVTVFGTVTEYAPVTREIPVAVPAVVVAMDAPPDVRARVNVVDVGTDCT